MDQESNASSGGLEVVEDLSHVSVTDCSACFDLDDPLRVDHEIGEIFTDHRPVLVSDLDFVSRVDVDPQLPESVREGVSIDLLKESGPEVDVGLVGRLPDLSGERLEEKRRAAFWSIHDLRGQQFVGRLYLLLAARESVRRRPK